MWYWNTEQKTDEFTNPLHLISNFLPTGWFNTATFLPFTVSCIYSKCFTDLPSQSQPVWNSRNSCDGESRNSHCTQWNSDMADEYHWKPAWHCAGFWHSKWYLLSHVGILEEIRWVFWGGLDFLPWILQNPLFLGDQGDGSYPSRPVAEHCQQNAGGRPRWGAGNMFCQLLCTWSKAEAERFDRWRTIVDSHYIAVFEWPWFTVNDSSLWEEVFNCFVCSNLHFSIRSQILRSLQEFLKSFWQS